MGTGPRLPLGRKRVRGAAAAGHLDILQWARAEQCPWDHSTYEEAERNGHEDVVR